MATSRRNRGRPHVAAVAMLVLALLLRLGWTVPSPADTARNPAAAFGEHALCLAATSDQAPAVPLGDAPGTPGGHADHDASKCCQWHASGGTILPSTGETTPVAVATLADRLIGSGTPPAGRSIAGPRARAPPFAAG